MRSESRKKLNSIHLSRDLVEEKPLFVGAILLWSGEEGQSVAHNTIRKQDRQNENLPHMAR
jgi:hypothetical protein